MTSDDAFHDICGDRERGAPKLAAQLESFEIRKGSYGHLMNPDEEIVRTLPCDQILVA